jgi:hypothetical protein
MKTGLTLTHLRTGREECISKSADLIFWLSQQMQGKSLGRSWPNPRQTLELVDQASQGSSKAAQGSAADTENLGSSPGGNC